MEKKCDIILLSYENVDLLEKCVESIFSYTKIDSRLIIVDNGSTDSEVISYINSLQGTEKISIEKLLSSENAGFAGGMNKGLKISEAPYVCLLNNDCEVTDGWLGEMIKIAESNKNIGLINPQSSTFGSRPETGVSYNSHAKLLSDKKGKYVELGHAIGFALLVKREVTDKIGYLDEKYEGVCYEDTDFSVRAQKAGYFSVMAEGAYVFHHEQASRRTLPEKEKIYKKNKELFESKWGKILRVFYLNASPKLSEGQNFIEVYNNLKSLARDRVFIDLWVADRRNKIRDSEPVKNFFKNNYHADVHIKFLPVFLLSLFSIWKVLTKKKKYNAVILRKGFTAIILKLLKPFHQSEIIINDEASKLTVENGQIFSFDNVEPMAVYLRK